MPLHLLHSVSHPFRLSAELTTEALLRSFRYFVARRGLPNIVSDNDKTFKAAERIIKDVMNSSEVQKKSC